MTEQSIEPSIVNKKNPQVKFSNIFSAPILKWIVIGAILLLLVLNIVQLVYVSRLLKTAQESNQMMVKIDGIAQSLNGMLVLVDQSTALGDQVSTVNQKVDTLSGIVRDLPTPSLNPDHASLPVTELHLRFQCNDAVSGDLVNPCPIRIKVIALEPAHEVEIQGNNQAAIMLPMRIRMNIEVQAAGYKPFARVFEFLDTGEMQDYQIKLEK